VITVRFSGALRQVAGRAEMVAPAPASGKLSDLLAELESVYPGILGGSAEIQWRHGATHVMAVVNGRVVDQGRGEGVDAMVADGDVVTLLAPLGGG
jgi:molybdopterin converting factor small subunit